MIDLYALPDDYPGRGASRRTTPAAKGCGALKARMRETMPSRQWIPYVQLHEFEALLYTDLDALASRSTLAPT